MFYVRLIRIRLRSDVPSYPVVARYSASFKRRINANVRRAVSSHLLRYTSAVAAAREHGEPGDRCCFVQWASRSGVEVETTCGRTVPCVLYSVQWPWQCPACAECCREDWFCTFFGERNCDRALSNVARVPSCRLSTSKDLHWHSCFKDALWYDL